MFARPEWRASRPAQASNTSHGSLARSLARSRQAATHKAPRDPPIVYLQPLAAVYKNLYGSIIAAADLGRSRQEQVRPRCSPISHERLACRWRTLLEPSNRFTRPLSSSAGLQGAALANYSPAPARSGLAGRPTRALCPAAHL